MSTPVSVQTRGTRWPWVVAATMLVLSFAGLGKVASDPASEGPSLATLVFGVVLLITFLGSGATLLSRRPDHPVSWLLPLPGIYLALESVTDLIEPALAPTAALWVRWFAQVSWAYSFPSLAIFLPLLFPTGRTLTPRWRWVIWTGTAAVVFLTVGNAVAPDLFDDAVNPAAVDEAIAQVIIGVGGGLMVLSFVAATASAVVRFRRSVGVERQQLRWFTRAAALVPVAWIVAVVLENGPHSHVGGWLLAATLSLLPVAVTVAVLRYRLYDIDRVVSRVVAYAIVSAVLAGVYAGGVLGVGAVLPGKDSDLLVAGSTLAVAGAFHPLRRRVQTIVDRRFARTQHDATAAVAGFAGRLRDEVKIEAIEHDLGEVVRDLWSPTHASVWLRGGRLEAGS